MAGLIGLLVLGGIVIGLIVVVRRVLEKRGTASSDGGDVLAYLLMALAVGVAAFALAELGQAAFPGDALVLDTDQLVATSLAGLVVATPIAGFLWRRQSQRRTLFPRSAGWTLYLALIEAVFMTALVIAVFTVLDWLIGDGGSPTWTDVIVFGGVVVFHELAARRTPPTSDGADLPRVVGSAIGLVTTAIGAGGSLFWLFERIYSSFQPTAGGPVEIGTWLSLLIVGIPVWWYRWWRPWPDEPGIPRLAWSYIASVAGLVTGIGTVVWLTSQTLIYLFTDTETAGTYFDTLPALLSVGIVGLGVWLHHRRRLGTQRTDAVRAYEYTMAAIGLGTVIGGATGLTSLALGPSDLVNVSSEAVIAVTTVLLASLAVWGWFWRRASAAPREIEAATGPRRFYLIGLGVVTGLVSAGALIATLVILFQRLLGSGDTDTLAIPASLFVYAGLATWHLLRTSAGDRDLIVSEEVVTPFNVTIICSHPGMIATAFPKEARLRVVYRDDESGVIDETMAREIVQAVANRSSLVWVDEGGYRVAPAR